MHRLLLAGVFGMFAATASAQPIKIGDLGIVADAPFYIAIEKGYFAAEKLDVSLERFNSAAQATAPLSTNQIQVIGGGVSAALYNAFARDWPVRIAMARTRDWPGYSSDTLILRNDLKDTVKSARDLKGKVVAINAPASVLQFMLGRFMETDGLGIEDVQTINMPWPSMGPGLETKAIDAGTVVEPFAAQYAQKNVAFPFRRAADFMKKPATRGLGDPVQQDLDGQAARASQGLLAGLPQGCARLLQRHEGRSQAARGGRDLRQVHQPQGQGDV